jgi:hypothetical protein
MPLLLQFPKICQSNPTFAPGRRTSSPSVYDVFNARIGGAPTRRRVAANAENHAGEESRQWPTTYPLISLLNRDAFP